MLKDQPLVLGDFKVKSKMTELDRIPKDSGAAL